MHSFAHINYFYQNSKFFVCSFKKIILKKKFTEHKDPLGVFFFACLQLHAASYTQNR